MPAQDHGHVAFEGAELFYRTVGEGPPIVVLHGGPDFDHEYLVPDLDRVAGRHRLIYYDQRGRGRSGRGVRPEDVGIESEMRDLAGVISHFGLASAVLLGHSWGTLLALEYALRHPVDVSGLILLNPVPVTHDGLLALRRTLGRRPAGDLARMRALADTEAYRRGDPETDLMYCRSHFRATVPQPEALERVLGRLRVNFTADGVLLARAVEERLYHDTWLSPDYDLLSGLGRVGVPTLIIRGEYDFIPDECVAPIAAAIPGARYVTIGGAGHFSYMDRPDVVGEAIARLLA